MGARICPSALGFVKPVKGNFAAESVSGGVESVKVEPVKVEPVKVEPVKVEPVKKEEPPKVIYVPPVASEPEEEPAFKFCYKCGMKLAADDAFCRKCGAKQ